MPHFETNVDGWVACFAVLRILLVCWCIFLVLPKTGYQRAVSNSYTGGAVIYVYFAVVGIMYQPHHTCQGTIFFVFSAMFAVPFLETNPLAGRWLQIFLLLDVLVPSYFFAGVRKLRYEGLWDNISGHCVAAAVVSNMRYERLAVGLDRWMASAPAMLGSIPWPFTLMSWGNLVIEVVLPVLVMWSATAGPKQAAVLLIFYLTAICFHVAIFVMNPNFLQMLLLIFASKPLYIVTASKSHEFQVATSPSLGDFRGIYAMMCYGIAPS